MTKPPEPGGTPGRPNPSPPGTKLGALLLRGYLVISMLLLIAKAVQLGRGFVGSDEPIGRAQGGLGSSFGPGGRLSPRGGGVTETRRVRRGELPRHG